MTSDDLEGVGGELGRLRAEVARLTAELAQGQQRETTLQDRLTGTASILRAIAAGPNDAPAVLQSIVETAARLCQADQVVIFRVDDDEIVRVANLSDGLVPLPVGQRMPLSHGSWSGRAIVEKRTIRHDDVELTLDEY